MKTERLIRLFKPLIVLMLIVPAAYSVKVHLDKIKLVEQTGNNADVGFGRNNLIEKSAEQLQLAAEAYPSSLTFIELGKKYEDIGEPDKAIIAFEKAVQLNDSSSYAHYYLCKLLNEKELYEKALEHCNKTIALLPGFELAEYQKEICIHRLEGVENWK